MALTELNLLDAAETFTETERQDIGFDLQGLGLCLVECDLEGIRQLDPNTIEFIKRAIFI